MRSSIDTQQLVALPVLGDSRGSLCVIEGERDTTFPIARVYYIFGTDPTVARGFHAHRELNQLAVCLHGSCVIALDDGFSRRDVKLERPDEGLTIGPMIWREMRDFSNDAVLMVLADRHYEESDYIRNYDVFVKMAHAT